MSRNGDMNNQREIQELIRKHRKMFQELPMELPPNRKTEHIIEIEPGTKNLLVTTHTDIHIRDVATVHVVIVVK